ncbi:MAG: AgmX/PglI C-terminal domain-containing protein [Myxococcales bacterium]|nr:AgmX/PglI C-terminal domain-containing protein [Myxococcales bacterium]
MLAASVACAALCFSGRAEADSVMELIGVMQASEHYKERVTAVIGLARLRSPRSVPALLAQLEDKHHAVRGVVAAALGKIGDRRALETLRALAASDKNTFVRRQAKRAIRAIERAKPRAPATPPVRPMRSMKLAGTLGSLDAGLIQQTVNQNLGRVTRCFNTSFQSQPFLGGEVKLRVRVKRDGSVKWLRIEHSNLGSRRSESCILATMRYVRFDRPSGGEAEFTIPLRFGGGDAPRLLTRGSAVARALRARCRALLGAASAPPDLTITAYVKRGRVVSAGLSSAAAPISDAFANRLIRGLTRAALGHTGRRVAKLTYSCR